MIKPMFSLLFIIKRMDVIMESITQAENLLQWETDYFIAQWALNFHNSIQFSLGCLVYMNVTFFYIVLQNQHEFDHCASKVGE